MNSWNLSILHCLFAFLLQNKINIHSAIKVEQMYNIESQKKLTLKYFCPIRTYPKFIQSLNWRVHGVCLQMSAKRCGADGRKGMEFPWEGSSWFLCSWQLGKPEEALAPWSCWAPVSWACSQQEQILQDLLRSHPTWILLTCVWNQVSTKMKKFWHGNICTVWWDLYP